MSLVYMLVSLTCLSEIGAIRRWEVRIGEDWI